MEGAGKLIDDEELKAAMQEKGLGTPATRAQVIEGLILEKYMYREGRELIPTAKAFQLMTLLRGLAVEDLTKPELTGQWEHQLAQMEKGKLSRDEFGRRAAKGNHDRHPHRRRHVHGSGVIGQHHPAEGEGGPQFAQGGPAGQNADRRGGGGQLRRQRLGQSDVRQPSKDRDPAAEPRMHRRRGGRKPLQRPALRGTVFRPRIDAEPLRPGLKSKLLPDRLHLARAHGQPGRHR